MKVAFVVLTVVVGASGIVVVGDGEQPTKFKINTKKKDDAVEVQTERDRTLFAVKSSSGISQAVIEREGEKWPEAVVLRLHLKGLESFRVSNGKVTLNAAVSSNKEGKRVRVWKDNKEADLLDEKSAFWMEIRLIGADGKPATEIPLKGGYFEIAVPKAFFENNPKSITLNWIDFYRN